MLADKRDSFLSTPPPDCNQDGWMDGSWSFFFVLILFHSVCLTVDNYSMRCLIGEEYDERDAVAHIAVLRIIRVTLGLARMIFFFLPPSSSLCTHTDTILCFFFVYFFLPFIFVAFTVSRRIYSNVWFIREGGGGRGAWHGIAWQRDKFNCFHIYDEDCYYYFARW